MSFHHPSAEFCQQKLSRLSQVPINQVHQLSDNLRAALQEKSARGIFVKEDRLGRPKRRIVSVADQRIAPPDILYIQLSPSRRTEVTLMTSFIGVYSDYIDLASVVTAGYILGQYNNSSLSRLLVDNWGPYFSLHQAAEFVSEALVKELRGLIAACPQVYFLLRSMIKDTGAGSSGIELAIRNGIAPDPDFQFLAAHFPPPPELGDKFKGIKGFVYDKKEQLGRVSIIECAGMPIAFAILSEVRAAVEHLNLDENFCSELSLHINMTHMVSTTVLALFSTES